VSFVVYCKCIITPKSAADNIVHDTIFAINCIKLDPSLVLIHGPHGDDDVPTSGIIGIELELDLTFTVAG
jgi:hypothetical protein